MPSGTIANSPMTFIATYAERAVSALVVESAAMLNTRNATTAPSQPTDETTCVTSPSLRRAGDILNAITPATIGLSRHQTSVHGSRVPPLDHSPVLRELFRFQNAGDLAQSRIDRRVHVGLHGAPRRVDR